MTDIVDLAKRCADADARVSAYGAMNSPSDPAERVRADALMLIARDVRDKAYDEYRRAIVGMSAAELAAIASKA